MTPVIGIIKGGRAGICWPGLLFIEGNEIEFTLMKTFRLHTLFTAAALLICLAGTSQAFHDGGVGACEGCHTMHNSINGSAMTTKSPQYQAGSYLLKASDQSSTCLNCHERAGTMALGAAFKSATDSTCLQVRRRSSSALEEISAG
jgi:hypothetical protein